MDECIQPETVFTGEWKYAERTAFLEKAGPGEYCFVEDKDVVPYESRIEEVILCHWNRDYPADMYFKMDLGSWKLAETQEYAGSSHEKITEERYVRR